MSYVDDLHDANTLAKEISDQLVGNDTEVVVLALAIVVEHVTRFLGAELSYFDDLVLNIRKSKELNGDMGTMETEEKEKPWKN